MLLNKKDIKKLVREICQFYASVDEFRQHYQILGNPDDIRHLHSTLLNKGISCSLSNKYNRVLNIDKIA